MTRQIAVRLPDDLVDFVDEIVHDGKATSRADVVRRALEHERRRTRAIEDAAILSAGGDDPDMDNLAIHVAHAPLDLE